MPRTASCSTTRARSGVRLSSPGRSPGPSRRSSEGLQKCLYLGNLDAQRDWGHARDYVDGMWRIVQQDVPDDYACWQRVRPTPCGSSSNSPFRTAGRDIEWIGTGVDEKGLDARTGMPLIEIDPRYFRPTEVDLLLGNPAKARGEARLEPHHPVR